MSYHNSHKKTKSTNGEHPHFQTALIFIILFAACAAVLCVPAGAALSADVQGNTLSDTQTEGAEVTYTVVITGIPSQTAFLELSTDLIPVSAAPLWTVSTDGVTMTDSPNERLILLTAVDGFPVAVTIEVNGRIPTISTTKTVDGIVITQIASQRSGYLYYDVKSLDAQGKSLSVAATGTLTIEVEDEQSFLTLADAIEDSAFRNLVTKMYARGLTTEAWGMLEWYEAQPTPMPFFIPLIAGMVALAIGLIAGIMIGMNLAYARVNKENED